MKAVFLDIGNTNTSFAFSTSKQKIEIISTKKLISEDYIKNFLLENSIETVVCASVVPNISDAFTSVCFKLNIICKILNFSNIPLQTNVRFKAAIAKKGSELKAKVENNIQDSNK